jgi:hypothetical protein
MSTKTYDEIRPGVVSELRLDRTYVPHSYPRWHSYYLSLPDDEKSLTIKLAVNKFGAASFETDTAMQLAALDCRVLLQYDPYNREARDIQKKLVKSYMRVVFMIPENREFMWSGFSSEPMINTSNCVSSLTKSMDQCCAKRCRRMCRLYVGDDERL